MDHFERLGLDRSARIDPDELERKYLQRSREVHPDLNGGGGDSIVESAALNDAYRTLKDSWKRFSYLAELLRPGVMDANKKLCPVFLAETMELFEEAELARDSPEKRAQLEDRVAAELEDYRKKIEDLLEDPKGAHDAAVLVHQARYLQRTLQTLREQLA